MLVSLPSVDAAAKLLGGEASGLQVRAPGPGHSTSDRSMSVRFDPRAPDGFVVTSFAGDGWQQCRDHVATRLDLRLFEHGRRRRPMPVHGDSVASNDKSDVAAALWRKSQPIGGTLGERYLREGRGILCALPPTIRFLPPSGRHPATILTAFGTPLESEPGVLAVECMDVPAVHRIQLNAEGSKLGKAMLGSPAGLPLVVAPWTDSHGLVIAEGVEDALSAHQATGLAAWAGGSAPHMAKLAACVPAWTECVTIIEDDNDAGRKATRTLADALGLRGIEVIVVGEVA